MFLPFAIVGRVNGLPNAMKPQAPTVSDGSGSVRRHTDLARPADLPSRAFQPQHTQQQGLMERHKLRRH